MNWLTNFVRPKIQALVEKKDVPENLWVKCTGCAQMIFHRDLVENKHVCTNCGHHMRYPSINRLQDLFDDGKYKLMDESIVAVDPLKFKDLKRYTDRLKASQSKTKRKDALMAATGKLNGQKVTAAVFNFGFMGGSMGTAVGEGIVRAALAAAEKNTPFIIFVASGGARMQEGILSLMQMPRTIIAVEALKEKNLPFIVVLTDPTTGGVSASFAMVGDVHIAEPGSVIGFAGARVIEETIREKLPEGFQTAEYLLEHGMVDMVTTRHEMRDTLARVLGLLTQPKLSLPKAA